MNSETKNGSVDRDETEFVQFLNKNQCVDVSKIMK